MVTRLKKIEPYEIDDIWFFKLTYEEQRPDGIYEIILPKVLSPFYNDQLSVERHYDFCGSIRVELLSDKVNAYRVKQTKVTNYLGDVVDVYDSPFIEVKVKDNPPKEMTIRDIEKQLGYSIKIVKEE